MGLKGIEHRDVRELFIRGRVNKQIEGPEEKDEIYSLKACITSNEQTKIKKSFFPSNLRNTLFYIFFDNMCCQ